MKVRIIKANGVKEAEQIFDLEFLHQFIKKADITADPLGVFTGDYVTTGSDLITADGIKYTDSSATSVIDSAKLFSSTS